ncbi:zinc finger protein jing homolog [Periplaneta americana]|uniref:zinc finger protein jing homolog n=1 Tax=Periplaneta americana TaxID=6978 RepID=UPI0037E8E40E
MADGVCAEGTDTSVKDSVVKQSVDLISISHKDCLNSNTLNTLKSSFYINGDSGELCSSFRIDGVVGLGVRASAMLCSAGSEFCPNNGDNCRKKRCADRYDSSESSDSGVATLSCTDCSTSSSGTSDITDPGSPYSPASTHSSASEASDDCSPRKNAVTTTAAAATTAAATLSLAAPPYCGIVTPPVQSRHWATTASSCKTVSSTATAPSPGEEDLMAPNTQEPSWPWGGKERDKGPPPPPPPLAVTATPLTPVTANVIANLPLKSLKRQTAITSHKTATASAAANKRLKVDHHHSSNNNCVKVTSRCVSKNKCCSADNKSHDGDASPPTKVQQQGKITEYFKTQVKPLNGVKKELVVKSSSGTQQGRKDPKTCGEPVAGLNKYFPSLHSGTKSAAAKSPTRTAPLSKASEAKRDSISGGASSSPSWTKSSTDSKPSKASQKVTAEKKTGAVLAVVSARKISSTSAASKFLESKRNGLIIPTSSQKLNALLSPATTQSSSLSDSGPVPAVGAAPKGVLSSEAFKTAKEAVAKPKTIVSETECIASPLCDEPTPILSVPTTIRFPAVASDSSCSSSSVLPPKPSSSQSESPDSIVCRWSECDTHFDSSTGLLEHLQAKHVNPQVSCENYVCLWVGCKVYARTSCSRSWLERHVLSHGGNKPFRCIVDGCGQRFSSQTTLERHVNGHFNQSEAGNGNASARRSLESASSKLFRRNGKKLRYRRQPWSARMFDYFDAGIMEGLQHRLVNMTEVRTQGNVATAAGNTVSLHSKVLARRVESDGRMRVLVRWFPEDILPDEWVAEAEAQSSRSVPIPNLSAAAMVSLQSALFVPVRNKQRRKPAKPT